MKALIELLNNLTKLLTNWLRKQEAEQHQQEAEQIEKDPHDWFVNHFDGLPERNASEAPSPNPDTNAKE